MDDCDDGVFGRYQHGERWPVPQRRLLPQRSQLLRSGAELLRSGLRTQLLRSGGDLLPGSLRSELRSQLLCSGLCSDLCSRVLRSGSDLLPDDLLPRSLLCSEVLRSEVQLEEARLQDQVALQAHQAVRSEVLLELLRTDLLRSGRDLLPGSLRRSQLLRPGLCSQLLCSDQLLPLVDRKPA